jgi:hypothetical protein
MKYSRLTLIIWIKVTVFYTTFNNVSVISWLSVLLVEETGEPGENHQSAASHWQTLSHNVVSSAPRSYTFCLSVLLVEETGVPCKKPPIIFCFHQIHLLFLNPLLYILMVLITSNNSKGRRDPIEVCCLEAVHH